MPFPWKATILAIAALAGNPASAEEASTWPPAAKLDHVLVQTSLYTRHYDRDPEHTNQQNLISVEFHNPQRWLAGAAWFRNSFNQPTWYWYAGREFPLWKPTENTLVRAKLTGGLLRGYKDEYRDKIPFNHSGIAPAVLPSIGMQWGRVESDLILFGAAGLMVTGGVRF